ncbi:MAG: EpsG family protein [Waterburya sp.]
MLDQTFDKIKNIQNVTELKLPLLFFAFAVWVSFPILGIFPFLLTIQLDLLKPNAKPSKLFSFHTLLLILVLITVAIYLSSFNVFADTKIYLDIYNSLDRQNPFENIVARERFEFVLFVFFDIVHYLSNESEFWCLFSLAIFNNSLIIFYISKKFSPKYYPTLLIILFSSYFYYSQVFYMRQFFALVFVLAAIASMESSQILFIIFSLLAVFSHTTSVIYVLICFFTQSLATIGRMLRKIRWESRDKIFLYCGLVFLVVLLIYVGLQIYNDPKAIYRIVNDLADFVPQEQVSKSIQGRVENNDGRDTDLFKFDIFLAIATFSTGIFILVRSYKKISPKILTMIAIYFVSILQILFILVTGFNQRIVYLFLAFFGLFFCIGLDDQKLNRHNKIKSFALVSAITIFMAASNTYNFLNVQVNMIDIDGWSFFEKRPLNLSLFDYIIYFFKSL